MINLELLQQTQQASGLYTPLRPMDKNILYFTGNYDMVAHYAYVPPRPQTSSTSQQNSQQSSDTAFPQSEPAQKQEEKVRQLRQQSETQADKRPKPAQEKPYYVEDCSFDEYFISRPKNSLASHPEQEAVKIAKALEDLDKSISTASSNSMGAKGRKGQIIDPRKERHRILEDKVCRFCGKKRPEVTFNKQAHAISELIGNKTIFLRNECDSCNEIFSTFESDFSNFIGIGARTLSQTEGKSGIPTYKNKAGNTRIEVGEKRIVMQQVVGQETPKIEGNTVFINTEKLPYVPLSAYKALVAMALSVIPEDELGPFSETIEWLLGKKEYDFSRYAKRVIYRFIPGVKPLPVQAWVLRRKSFLQGDVQVANAIQETQVMQQVAHRVSHMANGEQIGFVTQAANATQAIRDTVRSVYNCPFCHFILEFDNYSFQIIVPCLPKDDLFQPPEMMMFPGTVDAWSEIAWDTVSNHVVDLSSDTRVTGDVQTISLHVGGVIQLDPKELGTVQDVADKEGVKHLTPTTSSSSVASSSVSTASASSSQVTAQAAVNGNAIISNVIWKFAERILAQFVTLIVSIILARLLLPSDFGAISMVLVFINIANIFVIEGIPSALIQRKNADQLDFSSVFLFNFVFSLLVYSIIFFSAPCVASFYNYPLLFPVFRVLGLRILVAAVNSVQHAYVSRHMMFKKYFWSTLFGTLLSGIVGVMMAYLGFGIWSLVAQYMVNTIVDTVVLFITVAWRPTLEFSFYRVKTLFIFGWKMLFEGLSNTIAGQIRNLIIGKVYTPSDLAFYTKGQQFPALFVTNISSSIASVLFPAMANEQEHREQVLNMLRKSIRVSSYVVYPMLVGLAMVATPFIKLVLTDKWIETVPYLQVFCFLNLPVVGMIPRHQALLGTGRSDVFMNEHILSRIIGFLILFLVYRISVFAIVVSGIISSAILSLIIAFTSKKYNGYGYKDQIADILPTLIACTIMAVPVYFIQFLGLSSGLTLFLQITVGAVVYILYSKIAHLEEYAICKEYACTVLVRVGRGVNKFKKEGVSN